MKKYFAKYLVVQENIKVGDLILDINGVISKHTKDTGLLNTDKKVKLFLCSREIHNELRISPDEPVYLEAYSHISTIKELIGHSSRDIVLTEMPESIKNNTLDRRQLLNIIGEIHPDDNIKEGQEFDREDFYFGMGHDNKGKLIQVDFKGKESNIPGIWFVDKY